MRKKLTQEAEKLLPLQAVLETLFCLDFTSLCFTGFFGSKIYTNSADAPEIF